MCYITDADTKLDIVEAIHAFVRVGRTFTGYDVYKQLNPENNDWDVSPRDVSSYVRELFNRHHMVFAGYACYPLPDGPLMYFLFGNTSEEVINYGGQILQKLQEAKEAEEREEEG